MPDYKEMYLSLFKETTKAINVLQSAQQIYLVDDTQANLIPLHSDHAEDKES